MVFLDLPFGTNTLFLVAFRMPLCIFSLYCPTSSLPLLPWNSSCNLHGEKEKVFRHFGMALAHWGKKYIKIYAENPLTFPEPIGGSFVEVRPIFSEAFSGLSPKEDSCFLLGRKLGRQGLDLAQHHLLNFHLSVSCFFIEVSSFHI